LRPLEKATALDTFHKLTSFETLDALAVPRQSLEDGVAMIQRLAYERSATG
jgi:hypothetical protein